MDFESRRQRILDKMEDNSIAILYSGIEHHVSADEYDLFTAQANRNFFYLTGLRRDNMVLVLDKCVEPAKTIALHRGGRPYDGALVRQKGRLWRKPRKYQELMR